MNLFMGTKGDEVYLWWNAKEDEQEEWKILNYKTNDLIDMSFNSAEEARKYISAKGLIEIKKYEYTK